MPSPVPGPQPQVVDKAHFMKARQQAAGHHHNAGCWANRAAAHAAGHAAAPATLHTCVRQPSPHALSPTTAPPGTFPPHISFNVRCLFAGGPASSSSSADAAAASTRWRRRGSRQTMRHHGRIRTCAWTSAADPLSCADLNVVRPETRCGEASEGDKTLQLSPHGPRLAPASVGVVSADSGIPSAPA